MSKAKAKKPQDPREPNKENVAISKEILARMKNHKQKTGRSLRFIVEIGVTEWLDKEENK